MIITDIKINLLRIATSSSIVTAFMGVLRHVTAFMGVLRHVTAFVSNAFM